MTTNVSRVRERQIVIGIMPVAFGSASDRVLGTTHHGVTTFWVDSLFGKSQVLFLQSMAALTIDFRSSNFKFWNVIRLMNTGFPKPSAERSTETLSDSCGSVARIICVHF